MFFLIFVTVLQLIFINTASGESIVVKAFKEDNLVSKVVFDAPKELISVTYTNVSILLGTTVQPLQTLQKPQVSYQASDAELYTLMFFGPDFPLSAVPPLTQFLHWLVVNIPGSNISKGDTISSYFPPAPYPGGLPYIFLLYKQNGTLNTNRIPSMSFILRRPHFAIDEFARCHNLVGPIAGNFMHESYSEIIPQILQELYKIL